MYEAKLAKVQPDTVPACPADAPRLRRLLFDAVSGPHWGVALVCLVASNVLVRFLLSSDWLHYYEAPGWIHSQEAVFAVLYVLEWGCRAAAFGGVRAITRYVWAVRLSSYICTYGETSARISFRAIASVKESTARNPWTPIEARGIRAS